jgi:hypothetical protein
VTRHCRSPASSASETRHSPSRQEAWTVHSAASGTRGFDARAALDAIGHVNTRAAMSAVRIAVMCTRAPNTAFRRSCCGRCERASPSRSCVRRRLAQLRCRGSRSHRPRASLAHHGGNGGSFPCPNREWRCAGPQDHCSSWPPNHVLAPFTLALMASFPSVSNRTPGPTAPTRPLASDDRMLIALRRYSWSAALIQRGNPRVSPDARARAAAFSKLSALPQHSSSAIHPKPTTHPSDHDLVANPRSAAILRVAEWMECGSLLRGGAGGGRLALLLMTRSATPRRREPRTCNRRCSPDARKDAPARREPRTCNGRCSPDARRDAPVRALNEWHPRVH